ncbi:hypothetical protein BDZ89DRAFT_1083435 [Hymenopellis radicata]|nr:hypothetical protein BDZ89DRAFT_1083435 [Hymenopellis radicata]
MTFSLVAFSALAVYRSRQYLPCSVLLCFVLICTAILYIVSTSVLDTNTMASESSEVSLYRSNHSAEQLRPIAHSLPRRTFPLPAPTLTRLRPQSSSEKTPIPSTKEVPPDEALLRFGERRCTDGIYHPSSCGYRRCVDPSQEEREQSSRG